MAASFFDGTRNLSFYAIPAAWVLSIAPHFYAAQLAGKKFDNRNPRSLTGSLQNDQTLDQATKATIVRAEGAQQNGFENIGLFAAAVIAGNVAGVATSSLNNLSVGYLVSRIAYNIIYIKGNTETLSNVRTAVFLSGIGTIFTFFIKAGNAINARKIGL